MTSSRPGDEWPWSHGPDDGRRCCRRWELGVEGFCRAPRWGRRKPLFQPSGPPGCDQRSPFSSCCLPGLLSSRPPSLPLSRLLRPQGLCTCCPPPTAWTSLSLDLCMLAPLVPQAQLKCHLMEPSSCHPSYLSLCAPLSCQFYTHGLKSACFPHSLPASLACETPGGGTGPTPPLRVWPGLPAEGMGVPTAHQVFFLRTLLGTVGAPQTRISTLSESRRICLGK